jgi:hypothetical protein
VDSGVLPSPDLPPATLNVEDYADFAEHEGLALLAR